MQGWDSQRMIGKVEESYEKYRDRQTHLYDDPIWSAYYNGWLEGRGDMLMQMEQEIGNNMGKTPKKSQKGSVGGKNHERK